MQAGRYGQNVEISKKRLFLRRVGNERGFRKHVEATNTDSSNKPLIFRLVVVRNPEMVTQVGP
jgi:hypothetical protein